MDYSVFKPLLGLLFFGAALVFGFWQLAALRRHAKAQQKRERASSEDRPADRD